MYVWLGYAGKPRKAPLGDLPAPHPRLEVEDQPLMQLLEIHIQTYFSLKYGAARNALERYEMHTKNSDWADSLFYT
jgi:hypothetical protein